MYSNNCCCTPPPRRDYCSCKEGIACALDWFYQDLLSSGSSSIVSGSLKYYPKLTDIKNTIYAIPFISPDIVPVYIDSTDPTTSNLSYLSLCQLSGFEFQLNDTYKIAKENDIISRFSKICYTSPDSCCKTGLMEYLLKTKQFLTDNVATNPIAIISVNSNQNFTVDTILAINKDTVWAKRTVTTPSVSTTYYIISLCEIIGITLNKTSV